MEYSSALYLAQNDRIFLIINDCIFNDYDCKFFYILNLPATIMSREKKKENKTLQQYFHFLLYNKKNLWCQATL